jgi:septum formation protein
MPKKIYLASKSPRRQELLKLMNIEYELLLKDVDETYPESLPLLDVAKYIAKKKADAFEVEDDDALIITADTVVIIENQILGKPQDSRHAVEMLKKLSNNVHFVVTGVVLKTSKNLIAFDCTTEVSFKSLTEKDIEFYVENYQPLDKAGAYGIQDWIGAIGVKSINGSYTNVMGLPTQELYQKLKQLV